MKFFSENTKKEYKQINISSSLALIQIMTTSLLITLVLSISMISVDYNSHNSTLLSSNDNNNNNLMLQ